MNASPPTALGLPRLALLLAAVLYVLGAGVGPWAHAHAAPPPATEREDGRGNLPPAGHELDCVVCHAFGAAATPSGGELAVAAALPAPGTPCADAAPALAVPLRSPPARSPPHA